MGKPILYSSTISPPVRSVKLVAAAIGLELDVKEISLAAKEHLKEDYLKVFVGDF